MIESEKYRLIRRAVREFAKQEVAPLAESIEETGRIPKELYRKMAQNQYFGVTIPEEYGGCGAGYVAMAIVMEELARASVSATLYVTSPNTLLGLPILNYGTEEQKEKYLVPVMKGEKEGTFALTEPSAGSDAATQNTIARKDGDYYIINGRKAFITAAPLCDFAVVFAATDVSLGARGITAFIIERDTPGYSVGQPERKMGVNGSPTADIILENVKVHKSQILGEEGKAFQMAMKTLDSGRLVVAAQCLGIAEAAMKEAVGYVRQRRQFGAALSEFQGIQFMLADMETKLCCARALIYDAAEKTGTLKRSEVSGILNPEDMSAVRMAAALRREMENKGEKSSLTAITMGPPAASEVLREAMACGADEGILLCDRAFAGGDTFATSLVLAEAVKKAGGFSVIFTGRQTTDGETGHVGPQLAEHLGIGQLTLVRRVNWNGRLTAVRRFEGCLQTVECDTPAVIVCSGEESAFESIPIGAICKACEKQLIIWDCGQLGLLPEEIGLCGSRTAVRRTFLPQSAPKGRMLEGNMEEMAQTLANELRKRVNQK